jgi:hypothetical protein
MSLAAIRERPAGGGQRWVRMQDGPLWPRLLCFWRASASSVQPAAAMAASALAEHVRTHTVPAQGTFLPWSAMVAPPMRRPIIRQSHTDPLPVATTMIRHPQRSDRYRNLASGKKTVNEAEIAERLSTTATAVRASIRRLQGAGLAEMRPAGSSRLTLAGLAIALAMRSARMPRKCSWASNASRAA